MAGTQIGSDGHHDGFIARVKALLLGPKDAWTTIDRDMTPSGELFTRLAAPLAAIPALATFFSGQRFGMDFRPGFFASLGAATTSYILSLCSLLAISFIAARLAPRFDGEGSPRSAFKLVAYASVPAWLAAGFTLVPGLSFLSILGFYSAYLIYTGAKPLMQVSEEKVMGFTAATILCGLMLNFGVTAAAERVGTLIGGPAIERSALVDLGDVVEVGDIELPDEAGIDLSAIRDIIAKHRGKAVASGDLEALLPEAIGNYARTRTQSRNSGRIGSLAEGRYEAGQDEIILKIIDLSAVGALASMAMDQTGGVNETDEDGFRTTTNEDGTLVFQSWNERKDEGNYAMIIDKRFLIKAEGEATSIDTLRDAAAMIDTAELAALAK